jgi:LysM repeat protein
MYNVPPKDVAAYNNLQFENGLSVGESIKIPITENNFSQSEPAGSGEVLVPVYHTVQPKEGLYRVSLKYNKVPIASLKKWNHIQADAVSIGSLLIVGYLKVAKGESPLAVKGVKVDTNVAAVTKTETKPQPVNPDVNPERLPPVKNPDIGKQEKKDIHETDEHKVTVTSVNTKSNINFSGGYFKKLYNDQTGNKTPVNENGSVGIFKSTTGWQDGKYYCFNNDALPGTIIKITHNSTGKSVYAKVLDAIPDIKQNSVLTVILSNAAAEELGAAEGKFDCALSYVK